MSVKNYFLNRSTSILFYKRIVVFILMENELRCLWWNRFLIEIIHFFLCRAMKPHINLATGQRHISRG